ncbi:MAG: endonuclease, partial [Bacteroidetes bacterium]|nr:endonuclease [Bacteroidota bacterium]
MKSKLPFLLIFLITTSFFGQTPPAYYEGVNLNATGDVLFEELATKIISTHSGIPYTGSPVDVWDACKLADEDPDITANVLLIYGFDDADENVTTDRTRDKSLQDPGGGTGVWNREHVFSKSLAEPIFVTTSVGPGTDVHNLRPADKQRNSTRSNYPFIDGNGDGSYLTSNNKWYPGNEWKGDVARIIMYMYTRYHGDGSEALETNCLPKNVGVGTVNSLDPNMVNLFLQWNVEDPVSPFEANRNDQLANIQKNRNPFIDNPYLATLIWGGLPAEDKWNMGGSSDEEAPTTPTNLLASNIDIKSFDVSWDASTDNEGVYDYLVYVDGVYTQPTTSTSTSITNLSPDTSYTITIKARDVANNRSDFSAPINVTTLVGPKILFEEYFEDCNNVNFLVYNEESDENWVCNVGVYGENNSGSYGMNGYEALPTPSKDWLITKTPINFDNDTGEKLRFYADATYGIDPLELLYSSDYDGSSNPSEFNWESVPNVSPLIHDNSTTEKVYIIADADISAITGTVYFAFKYYSYEDPTRWTVDSFEISADNDNPDSDGDGVLNEDDNCPVIANAGQEDADGDGIGDVCDATPTGDNDNDGIDNAIDNCIDTANADQADTDLDGIGDVCDVDSDNDTILNDVDNCPTTANLDQLDTDNDGIGDVCDLTPTGDDDNDDIDNAVDSCIDTPNPDQLDTDSDGEGDLCDLTPTGDDDNDGIDNAIDNCIDTANPDQLDTDNDGEGDLCDLTPNGDDDNDG